MVGRSDRRSNALPLIVVGAFAFVSAPISVAALGRSIATSISPSHGPVEITACRAQLQPIANEYGYTAVVSVDFKNSGDKTATAVRLYFRADDAFGQPLQTATGDRLGTFAPGVAIQNWEGSNAKALAGLPKNVASVVCRVEMVRFADGSEWRGSYAPQGLYYPPTPSPTATP